ncbi:HET-domain-containing protein [Glonium stellatum]|uniref:HET-domain-containing protein n=1 Tax=Glonium stellatum TaxID=574774 RepID=A0A8E2JUH8_9PEZI|nr:HET-domain-containing protein [Glonium stellatum]
MPSPGVEDFDLDSIILSSKTFTLEFSSSETLSTIAQFTIEPAEDTENLVQKADLLSEFTGSEASLSQARQWLSHCVTFHNHHRSWDSDQWKSPTRVIDIGSATSDMEPRLIQTENKPLKDGYITLSHCWGSMQSLRLELGNEEDFQRSIPLTRLPLTFRHAITVARALLVQYIWIDALCIIQDSAEDWGREAEMMEKVYRRSLCNIAASDSKDGSGGLFFSRDKDTIAPYRFTCECDGVSNKSFYLTVGEAFWRSELQQSPLYRRAWVLQEQLLAPRTLHFTKEGIAWECHDLTASELYPFGLHGLRLDSTIMQLRETISQSGSLVLLGETHKSLGTSALPVDPGDFLLSWGLVVEMYTECALTFPGDKLVAIAGVTQPFTQMLGEHLAGLWRYYLPFELLWSVDSSLGDVAVRPSQYRAPSWSWASVEGPVSYIMVKQAYGLLDNGIFPWATVIDAKVEYKPGSQAEVVGGSLSIKGRLGQCTWRILAGFVATITSVANVDGLSDGASPTTLWDDAYIYFDEPEKINKLERDTPSIFCLLLSVNDQPEGSCHLIGLVLRRDEHKYWRVGVFTTGNTEVYAAMKELAEQTISIL